MVGPPGCPKTGLYNCQLYLYPVEDKKYYGREAQVIHPPVAIDRFKSEQAHERRGFVAIGAKHLTRKLTWPLKPVQLRTAFICNWRRTAAP